MEFDRTPETVEINELSDILKSLLPPDELEVVNLKFQFTGDHQLRFWRDVDRKLGYRHGKSHWLWSKANRRFNQYLEENGYFD